MSTESFDCGKFSLDKADNINDILNCIVNNSLQGVPSTTASPSDILTFDFVDRTKYKDEKIKSGFMKIFIEGFTDKSPIGEIDLEAKKILKGSILNSLYNEYNISLTEIQFMQALNYERYIYENVIKIIQQRDINPHFIKYIGSLSGVSAESLVNFISNKSGKNIQSIKSNFANNVYHMLNGLQNRPSLTDDWNKGFGNIDPDEMYYSFELIEGLQKPVNNKFDVGTSIFFYNFIQRTFGSLDLIKVIFQIATALYTLEIAGVAHNDLHANNAFVKYVAKHSINRIYNIEDTKGEMKRYEVLSKYSALIYDFDRSYIKGKNNPILEDDNFADYNQVNELVKTRDFLKIFRFYYEFLYKNVNNNAAILQLSGIQIKNIVSNLKLHLKYPKYIEENSNNLYVYQYFYDKISYIIEQIDERRNVEDVDYEEIMQNKPIKDLDENVYNKIISDLENLKTKFKNLLDNFNKIDISKCIFKDKNSYGYDKYVNDVFLNNYDIDFYKTEVYSLPEIIDNLYNHIVKYETETVAKRTKTYEYTCKLDSFKN